MTSIGPTRLAWLDIARGAALVAMALYHFVWDLAQFGLVPPETPFVDPWRSFARLIAGTFLLLVGVGLVIAHRRGIRWPSFWRRFATICAAAGLITAGTLFATPDAFIFFGILHMIAAGSLVGLALVNAPLAIVAFVAVAVAWLGVAFEHPFFDEPIWWWTGLGTTPIRSNDLVPFFPAFAAVAAGILAARLAGLGERPATSAPVRDPAPVSELPGRALAFLGRHSLIVYLVHQPLLIAGLWIGLRLLGRV